MMNKAGSAPQIKLCSCLTQVRLARTVILPGGSQLKHKVSPDEHTLAQTKSWKSGEREILKEKEERFGN